jgi:NAD(P)H dehydrogenase (quinone)
LKIVVTTPTGKVGNRVVRLLLQAGERPTLFLRDPGRLDEQTTELVDVVQGDQHRLDDVLRATEGADALYLVSPTVLDGDPVAAHAVAGDHAARAVNEHGIGRTVFQSSVGAEKRSGVGEIDGLARIEQLLDATGASVTHLRCGFFFTNLLHDPAGLEEGILRVLFDVDAPMSWVDPRDVGDVAAARLLSTAWAGRHVQAVHGPQDLTYAQAAAIVGDAMGRPVRAEQVADDDMRSALRAAGLAEEVVEAMVGMAIGLRGFAPEDRRTILTTTPTTLAAWAFEHLSRQP